MDIKIIIWVSIHLIDYLHDMSFSPNIYWKTFFVVLSAMSWDGDGEQDIESLKNLVVLWEYYEL